MKKNFVLIVLLGITSIAFSQGQAAGDTSWKKQYRAAYTKINDLVHTKLDVKFDYAKAYMYGKAWVTLKPHFYSTDSLLLDAKGMNINQVALVNGNGMTKLKYDYDSLQLNIKLNKKYKGGENYTVFIDYTSKPNEIKTKGSAAINDAKGLYFINPKGEDKETPTQIWTQGETEANSVWFPTIDKPNQKSTEEIYMTVPNKYVTLSNGLLISSKKNADGTRTDYWKMDLPHAPYLFFMGVGEYAVIKDSYKGKEVSYYVEKEYAPVARKIFGLTPEMIAFYSRITGVEFPWAKYSQIVGREYVSGAMENTTATLHQESAQQDARELVDGNKWEDVIAHELFHQWFGDLVTAESWSNLTLNESFADYSETLWNEYKYGKDAGDEHNFEAMQGYIGSRSASKDLVRYKYADKEDVFDAVSYAKGGRILHMLRNFLGDSAFFNGLHLYLTTNKFKSAEAAQLRLAFEEVSGRDLNWFFNEWYYGSGHPVLDISYKYDDNARKVNVTIRQTQAGEKTFELPIAIDIYNGSKKVRQSVWMRDREQTFVFDYESKPDLVNVDGDKILLCEKTDNKSLENFVYQYKFAGTYVDKREGINACAKSQGEPIALELLKTALKDNYYGLRSHTLNKLDMSNTEVREAVEPIIFDIAGNDKKPEVRAKAISILSTYTGKAQYKSLYARALNDSSYSVYGAALEALAVVDSAMAMSEVKKLKSAPVNKKISKIVTKILIESANEDDFDMIGSNFDKLPFGQEKFEALPSFAKFVGKVNDLEKFKKGINMIASFRDAIPEAYQGNTTPYINNVILGGIANQKSASLKGSDNSTAIQAQIDYLKSKTEVKKSF